MNDFFINVSGLLRKPGAIENVLIKAALPPVYKGQDEIAILGPVTAQAELKEAGGKVIVSGDVSAEIELTCGRCLKTFKANVKQPFSELFRRHGDFNREDPDEREDEAVFVIEDGKIDIEQMLTQAMVLSVPFTPVCREECPGLCPVCGEEMTAGHKHDEEIEEEDGYKAVLKRYLDEHQ